MGSKMKGLNLAALCVVSAYPPNDVMFSILSIDMLYTHSLVHRYMQVINTNKTVMEGFSS